MNLEFQDHIPSDFSNSSRVWIYQSNRPFTADEAIEASIMVNSFVAGWKSHGAPVKAFGKLFFNQFIVLMADETATSVGGCSTDSSVHLIRSLETKFNVQLLDRQQLAFVINDVISLIPLAQLNEASEANTINGHTLYFNNTVLTKKEWMEQWIIPANQSWIGKRMQFA